MICPSSSFRSCRIPEARTALRSFWPRKKKSRRTRAHLDVGATRCVRICSFVRPPVKLVLSNRADSHIEISRWEVRSENSPRSPPHTNEWTLGRTSGSLPESVAINLSVPRVVQQRVLARNEVTCIFRHDNSGSRSQWSTSSLDRCCLIRHSAPFPLPKTPADDGGCFGRSRSVPSKPAKMSSFVQRPNTTDHNHTMPH